MNHTRTLHHAQLTGCYDRDIKPDNILTDTNMHAHLGDFGLATRFKPGVLRTDAAGTWQYCPPEVLAFHREKEEETSASRPSSSSGLRGFDESIDWWGLGATAYHVLYGRPPYKARTLKELVTVVIEGQPDYRTRSERILVSAEARNLVESVR